MRLLFIHQNFPGQFEHVAPELARQGHQVVALAINAGAQRWPGVQVVLHQPQPRPGDGAGADPLTREWAAKLARGESAAQAMLQLRRQGFTPDVVMAHPGWGEALYVRDVFPGCRLLTYAEYFYGSDGGDTAFDPEFDAIPPDFAALRRLRLKNTHLLHALAVADEAVAPTQFQRSRHPAVFQDRIRVIHDGIDTDLLQPDPAARISLAPPGGGAPLVLSRADEVVSFVARNLEPYRGYHRFVRALPRLLAARPRARVVIVGGDDVSYGAAAPAGSTWKQRFLDEVAGELDLQRVHFVGRVPHLQLRQLMQVATVHCYLTYPFVLSWSMLEAMSQGCLVLGSRTAPVEEVIEHGRNGLLVDFFDTEGLADALADTLAQGAQLDGLRAAARRTVVERYDLRRQCLPQMLNFLTGATRRDPVAT